MSGNQSLAPIFLGPANAEQAHGWPWRYVKERARQLGIPMLGTGKKLCVSSSAFLAALERAALQQQTPRSQTLNHLTRPQSLPRMCTPFWGSSFDELVTTSADARCFNLRSLLCLG